MTAPSASVAAVQKALEAAMRCSRGPEQFMVGIGTYRLCTSNAHAQVLYGTRCEFADSLAVAAADAAVEAATPGIKAGALREYASELDWKRPDKCPCDNPEACCGSEASCDAMQPSVRVVGAVNLRARADRIEANR